MKTLISFTAALATVLLPRLAPAQDAASFTADICHDLGSYASQAAISRAKGIPISDVLDIVRSMLAANALPPASRKFMAAFTGEVERIVLAVYASDLSPNNAYLTYRGACQKAGAAGR